MPTSSSIRSRIGDTIFLGECPESCICASISLETKRAIKLPSALAKCGIVFFLFFLFFFQIWHRGIFSLFPPLIRVHSLSLTHTHTHNARIHERADWTHHAALHIVLRFQYFRDRSQWADTAHDFRLDSNLQSNIV